MIEKMNAKEKELLRQLQAKEKRIKRAEAEFWKQVDARKEEVLEHLMKDGKHINKQVEN